MVKGRKTDHFDNRDESYAAVSAVVVAWVTEYTRVVGKADGTTPSLVFVPLATVRTKVG